MNARNIIIKSTAWARASFVICAVVLIIIFLVMGLARQSLPPFVASAGGHLLGFVLLAVILLGPVITIRQWALETAKTN